MQHNIAYHQDPVLVYAHELGSFSAEMGGKKGRSNKGATDNHENSKDQQIVELTKQNKKSEEGRAHEILSFEIKMKLASVRHLLLCQ